jgi:flavin reductase (DIM6/NTAB) family NADH-FMN oxidoreductase RutF
MRYTGFFAWNLATYSLREELNITAQQLDPGEDEFVHAKLEKEDARSIPVPLVKDSPVRFECAFERCIELPGNPPMGTVSSFPPSPPLLLLPPHHKTFLTQVAG